MLFAGGTVVISLLGLFLIGVSFIRGLAVGASLAVLFVMAAAVTLLPAVLGFAGYTIDKFALPSARRKRTARAAASGCAGAARSRPGRGRSRSSGSLILVVLAVPFVSLRLGVADAGQRPDEVHDPPRRTTCSARASGPGSTVRCCSRATCGRPADVDAMSAPRRRRSPSDPGVAAGEPGDPEPERQGRAAPGRAQGFAAGREHDRARAPAPRRHRAGRDARVDARRARRWPDRGRRRPRRHRWAAACPACSSRSCCSASCC